MLTAAQIESFHRDGFLVLDALTTTDEIDLLRDVYDELFATPSGDLGRDHLELGAVDEDGRETLTQILNPASHAPALAETRARSNALSVARQLLGVEATEGGDHAIMKPPGHGAPTPWHQDEAYWDPYHTHSAISVWMPLQEATLDNGCMQFIPGSHALDVVPHRLVDADAHALEVAEPVDESRAKACPIPAGGCTIHHCRTLHYAGPNRSTGPRRAYIMGFSVPPVPLATPNDYYWQRPEWSA